MSLFSFFFPFLQLWSINESKKHGLLLTGGSSSYVAFVCPFSTVSSNCFSRKEVLPPSLFPTLFLPDISHRKIILQKAENSEEVEDNEMKRTFFRGKKDCSSCCRTTRFPGNCPLEEDLSCKNYIGSAIRKLQYYHHYLKK